ncbi:PTS sugar transporter subunit IIA [Aerococcus urinaeequi]|uniref:PTS sugar transporter subunit IIA n=1 Tax=Aerococcus urinaeequi TaxID=51665 RepID=UPI003D6C3D0A
MEINQNMVKLKQDFQTKEAAIRAAGQLLVDNGHVDSSYVEAMLDRENEVTTYMGNFIAIPHGTDEAKTGIHSTGISVLQIPFGVDFSDDPNEEKMAMVVFGIAGVNNEHLDLLSKIAIFCSTLDNVVKLVNAENEAEIMTLLNSVEAA